MKKYVLTGGPGSGKSSIIQALEIRHGFYTVREAAEDYIRLRQAEGKKEPWTDYDFQDKILELQLQREQRIPKNADSAFIDRGLHDGLAYAQSGTEAYRRIETAAGKARYEKIFLIEPLNSIEKTEVRRENYEEAVMLGRKLEEIYRAAGYEVINIKSGPLEQRVRRILEEIKDC